ncbi:MAG: TIGR00266 family protein [Firmicutes bacterium]|nr:TIGR00266 family protein [Bacillota bacterium]
MRYEIKGEPLPVVVCELEAGETMITEAGAMSWMSPNMLMETSGGGAKKMFGKLLSGESMFRNHYTAQGGPGSIAFAASFPGSIRAIEITPDKPVVLQKRAFLACTAGVEFSVFFQKKLGTALFGGEGFVMQQLSGSGLAFVEIDGSAVEYDLAPGQQMVIDTGHIAMMDATVKMDIQQVKGMKNIMFGGESLFNTVVTGPGKIVLQTMPLSRFAGLIASMMPSKD